MNVERRKEIEAAANFSGSTPPQRLATMIRELLDELDLREKQIAICRHMLGQVSGELGTIGYELEGLKSDNQR